MKKENSNKLNKKGFTLLELLVVVIIIGILAAIALPQYQMAVGRAKLSTLKDITKAQTCTTQRYYLINNTQEGATTKNLDIEIPSGMNCFIYQTVSQVQCCKNILGNRICYYHDTLSSLPLYCSVEGTVDKTNKSNRLCQMETGKSQNGGWCNNGNYCTYSY